MISTNGKTLHAEGDAITLMSEAGGALCAAYRVAREEVGERLAIGMAVKLVQSVIAHEKLRATDILEVIRSVEEIDSVLHG